MGSFDAWPEMPKPGIRELGSGIVLKECSGSRLRGAVVLVSRETLFRNLTYEGQAEVRLDPETLQLLERALPVGAEQQSAVS